jgi:hypothetical protein
MKKIFTILTILISMLCISNVTAQQAEFTPIAVVMPPAYAAAPGTTGFLGPLANSQRRYQLLMHESILTDLVGYDLNSISWRLLPSAAAPLPSADINIPNYEIYLSGSVQPSARDLTNLDNNIVGTQTKVRGTDLPIKAGVYPAGGSPNEWGPAIEFDTVWNYTGGHLLLEIRHQGFTGTSISVDAAGTSTTGYGTMYSAAWQGTGGGLQGNFAIVRIGADLPVPVELSSFNAGVDGSSVLLSWITATETNNYGFQIQRRTDALWETIAFVPGSGTTTDIKSYSFADKNLDHGNYTYRLRQVDYDGTGSYSHEVEVEIGIPSEYVLGQNYPNPFNPSTTIEFALINKTNVKLTIYNSLGEEIALLLNEEKNAGYHKINFNASGLISGVYFYELRTENFVQTKRMLLLK